MKLELPTQESLTSNPWLKFLGPKIMNPSLWRWKRHSVALGVAIGLFFGFLIPLAQIPLSAVFSVLFRANIIAAAASTLVTNPITFPFIYFAAYQVGFYFMTGSFSDLSTVITPAEGVSWLDYIFTTGKPVFLGLGLFAVIFGIIGYFITSFIWKVRTKLLWFRRRRRRSCKTI